MQSVLGLQPGLAGEVSLLISLLNLPGVPPSLHFSQTLKPEMDEKKKKNDSQEGWKTNLASDYSCVESC